MKYVLTSITIASLILMTFLSGCNDLPVDLWREFHEKSKDFPYIQRLYSENMFDSILIDEPCGLVLLRFHSSPDDISEYIYFAWSRADKVPLQFLEEYLWVSFEKRYQEIRKADEILVPETGIALHQGPLSSPVISSVRVNGDPLIIKSDEGIPSYGDLWMNTWAEDDHLYTGWGDGEGFGKKFTDMGFARLSGSLPNITGENRYLDPFTESDPLLENNKPSSLLFYNNTLYAHVHSPLGDAVVGYLASSKDKGKTWDMFRDTSPWTKRNESVFRCLFFINMGQDYCLNKDGYIYGMGIGTEWGWHGPIYLTRVQKDRMLDYSSYEYLATITDGIPCWSIDQAMAQPLEGIIAFEQFSVMYHEQTQRYLILTSQYVYDSQYPWGPWCFSGEWDRFGWYGYQPGIISKDTGSNYFWFTIAGQQSASEGGVSYRLNLGKMILNLR
jgi:hypothetical protein